MIGSIFSFIIILVVVIAIVNDSKKKASKTGKKQVKQAQRAAKKDAGRIRPNVPDTSPAPQRREAAAKRTKQRAVTEADRAKLETYRKQKAAGEDSRYTGAEDEKTKHRLIHEETTSFEEGEDYLSEVENLIVMGYDGSMNFERDFIGEAQDMLAGFVFLE